MEKKPHPLKGKPMLESTKKKISETMRNLRVYTQGRKTKDTPETRRKMEEATALDASPEEVAFYANISIDTYYTILKKDPLFSERLKALRNRPVLTARQTVVHALADPNHAFRYLERKRKREFGANMDLNLGGDVNITFDESLKHKFSR